MEREPSSLSKRRLCRNLKLSIEKVADLMGDEQIKFILEDTLRMIQVELCYPINVTTLQSRRYHIKEAIVIGLRQLVDQAISQGLINLMPSSARGVSTTLNIPDPTATADSATGFMTELDV
jgi:hypothetical protein